MTKNKNDGQYQQIWDFIFRTEAERQLKKLPIQWLRNKIKDERKKAKFNQLLKKKIYKKLLALSDKSLEVWMTTILLELDKAIKDGRLKDAENLLDEEQIVVEA